MLEYIKLDPVATFHKSHPDDAGYDMVSMVDIWLYPHESKLIPTGIKVAIPQGYQGILIHRSSIASKKGGEVILGVIDSGYRGEVFANTKNFKDSYRLNIKKGERFCQMCVVPIYTGQVEEVTEFSEVYTLRGEGAFGSTNN